MQFEKARVPTKEYPSRTRAAHRVASVGKQETRGGGRKARTRVKPQAAPTAAMCASPSDCDCSQDGRKTSGSENRELPADTPPPPPGRPLAPVWDATVGRDGTLVEGRKLGTSRELGSDRSVRALLYDSGPSCTEGGGRGEEGTGWAGEKAHENSR